MKLRHLSLLALVAPTLAVLPTAGPAAATRADSPAPAYAVGEWTDGDYVKLPDEPYSRVEVTYDATYGITLDGQVRTAVPSWKPATQAAALRAPSFDEPIVDVSGGTSFGLALDDEGHLHAWGDAPTIPAGDLTATYRDVAAYSSAALGVTTDGEVRFWGNAASQYDFDDAALAAADVVSVDLNSAAAVALTSDGHVLSAGYALDGTYFESSPFPEDRADETFTAVDTGVSFALGLTADGEVVSWGSYQNGEDQVPTFPEGRHAVAVSGGFWWAAAVLDDGSVVTWGNRERTQVPALRTGIPVVDIDLDRYRSAVTYATLASTSAPTISDTTPTFGDTLTATAGTWSSVPDEVHYEWRADGAVVGTDSPSYTPSSDDAWNAAELTVTVTAERDGFVSGTATSDPTSGVAQAHFTTGPTLTLEGDARVGRTLTAVASSAVPTPDDEQWMWFTVVRGDDPDTFEDDDLEPIEGADSATLAVTPDLAGKTVFANLTVTRAGYEPTFDDTEDVLISTGTLTAPKVTMAGKPRVGQVLTATVTDDPAAGAPSYQWLRGSTPIAGATSGTYRPVAADLGKRLAVRVTSSASGYAAVSATSTPTAAVTLGAARLKVTVPAKAKVGSKATIKVTGLAGGERFTVTVAGKRLSGKANGSGAGTVKLPVSGKPGTRAVTVVGSLPDRKGSTKLRIVKG